MAISINEFKLPITPQEARDYLQSETNSFGIFFDIDRCYELSAILQLEMLDMSRKAKRLSGNPGLLLDDKNQMIETLVKMGVNKAEFLSFSKRKKKPEAALTTVICNKIAENPKYSEEVHELVKIRNTYASNKRNKGNVENFANRYPISKALSKLNHRMSLGRPIWSILNTSRLAAEDPGIQGIPRSMPDIICEPYGYTLIRCDSGQIEPRINFSHFIRDELIVNLIIYHNDAYFGMLNYCLMSDKEIELCRNDFKKYFKPLVITEEYQALRGNLKTLTNAGSYGSSNLGKVNQQLAAIYDKRIVKHPARLAFEQRVRDQVKKGDTTFYGVFGTPVVPGTTERYDEGEDGWMEHVVRCGINNPVQTTASELMMFSINEARNILNEAKDTHICYYKHDEACFYVSDDDMANGVGDKLKEVTAYNVKGWIPIESDPVIGIKHGDYPSYIA